MKKRSVNKFKKRSSKASLIIKVTLLLVASLVICVTAYGVYLTKQVEHAANSAHEVLEGREVSKLREEKVEPVHDNVSILFVGVDDSDNRGQGSDHSRSDALILATLNNKTHTVKMLSIPRDSYVYIPKVGYKDKITHAHAMGGTLTTIETVEQLFDIPIDYYVRMNFNAFIDVVDALGGVEAEVPYALHELDEFDKFTINLQPGLQHLNGSEALALARTRKQDSDIERGKRQQEILSAIIKKVASVGSITKYDDVIKALGDNMKTDMTFTEMKSFLSYLSKGAPRIDTLTLEGTDDMSTGIYYYQLNQDSVEETKEIFKNHLGRNEESSSLTSSGSNNTGTDSAASDENSVVE
ncbi:LCP family protein [Lysinibacillus sp. fkY74-1]|uniref:LytR family transcriptional regulator n=2 Tax=Lysinibacillus TaxID=400634 RepID=W7S3J8_LYSSH|nr:MULTISPECIES: LCP family protein [Lysinibacillus]MBE5084749.1 LCP family protein [Bacillus thuringiensis]AMO34994.1 transcriptional regulator [Lysinibacillus sphaericus]AMR89891.1 transcriptional regulator [Lysinibacillus sphaericus]ANA47961.1 transcriptional regulator [Lysinibacillus sphaericus]EWH31210.1 LytR family transcriptional regulator [Lysinibacillus sphaericus CBAM5]